MRAQFNDYRLKDNYNMIAYDLRNCGMTKSTPTGKQDIWVGAADVAFLHHKLRLPPVHIFASEQISTYIAVRFAALFPEKVLSLTLCQVPPPRPLEWVHQSTDELIRKWAYSTEQIEMELVLEAPLEAIIGSDQLEEDLQDELFEHYLTQWNPTKRSKLVDHQNVAMNREPIEPNVAAAIKIPTLMIQGESSMSDPLKYAEEFKKQLVNVPGGARMYVVKGGRGSLNVIPSYATIVNRTFAQFLQEHSRAAQRQREKDQALSVESVPNSDRASTLSSTTTSSLSTSTSTKSSSSTLRYETLKDRMTRALADLANFVDNPSIAERDPRSPLSFSCVSPELERQQMESIYAFAEGQRDAFDPLAATGRPMRRWTQRHASSSWMEVDAEGMTTVDLTPLPSPHKESTKLPGSGKSRGKYRDRDSTYDDVDVRDVGTSARHRAPSLHTTTLTSSATFTCRTGSPPPPPPGHSVIATSGIHGVLPVSDNSLEVARARRAKNLMCQTTVEDAMAATGPSTANHQSGHAPERNAVVRDVVKKAAKNTAMAAVKMIL